MPVRRIVWMVVWLLANSCLFAGCLLLLDHSHVIGDASFQRAMALLCFGAASTGLWIFQYRDMID